MASANPQDLNEAERNGGISNDARTQDKSINHEADHRSNEPSSTEANQQGDKPITLEPDELSGKQIMQEVDDLHVSEESSTERYNVETRYLPIHNESYEQDTEVVARHSFYICVYGIFACANIFVFVMLAIYAVDMVNVGVWKIFHQGIAIATFVCYFITVILFYLFLKGLEGFLPCNVVLGRLCVLGVSSALLALYLTLNLVGLIHLIVVTTVGYRGNFIILYVMNVLLVIPAAVIVFVVTRDRRIPEP